MAKKRTRSREAPPEPDLPPAPTPEPKEVRVFGRPVRVGELCRECERLGGTAHPASQHTADGCGAHLDPDAHHAADRDCDCRCERTALEVLRKAGKP